MLKSSLLAVIVIIISSTFVFADGNTNVINKKHLDNSLTCKSCHGVDKPSASPGKDTCIECHGEVVKTREINVHDDVKVKVHESHYGEIDCLECHKIHGKGQLMCNQCHKFNIDVK
ncbi:MAG: cytochrome c3 family protein [Desulfuromonadales bacterium]|nr:cytochrome c3 family protein [Desulfuromonadales bacterium]